MTVEPDARPDALDRFVPDADRSLRHTAALSAPPEVALSSILTFDAFDSPVARTLIGARAVPGRIRRRGHGGERPRFVIEDLPDHGWIVLEDRPGVERVYGTIGRPWSLRDPGPVTPDSPEAFAEFTEDGFAKVATSFRAEPHGEDGSLLVVETRVRVTDPVNRRRFLRYWRLIEPFSRLIRWEALRLLRRRLGVADTPTPASLPSTIAAFGRCAWATVRLWRHSRLHHVPDHVGWTLRFGDGSTSHVYRETVSSAPRLGEPCLLVVRFTLRLIGRNPLAHAVFRAESLLNTPLFAGYPGFRSKLWLTDPDTGIYRGVYEWDGADQAAAYAETLSRLLRLVSVHGSVCYEIDPSVTPARVLADPGAVEPGAGLDAWWRIISATPPRR